MALLNRVQLTGSLSNKPEIKYTPTGEEIVHFSLVEDSDTTNIIPISASGQLGKQCIQSLKEGSLIYLEGRLKINRYIEKVTSVFEGEEYKIEEERISVKVVAKTIEFLDDPTIKKSQSDNKEKIEDVIRGLEFLAGEPYVSQTIISNLISLLNSLELENLD